VDEQTRADRFRFPRDSHRFIASRGILRTLLGRYLHVPPAHLRFCYGDRGKPALAEDFSMSGLQFNLSHSEDLMLCAIACNCLVGIDLEYIRPIDNLEDLTQRFFSPQEHAAIHALPTEARLRSFFQHWTCKEALLKATGDGLVSLSAIELSIEHERAALTSWNYAAQMPNQWSLQLLVPASGYVAAVAINSRDRSSTFLQWDDKARA
jgi:4'-phosphopantetheinyl transferase